MGTFAADLKYGVRLLVRTPVVSLIAILTLALGIGANTAIFSVVHAVVMKPLPYPHADRLVELYTQFPGMGFDKFWFSSPEFLELQHDSRSFASVGAYQIAGAPVIGGEIPVRAVTAYCSPSFLPTIGVEPLLGSYFTAAEDMPDHPQGVILSYALWQRLFAGDPHIVGRSIRVDSDSVRVDRRHAERLQVSRRGDRAVGAGRAAQPDEKRRASHAWSVIARLADGGSPAQALSELRSLESAWQGKHKHAIGQKHPMVLKPLMGEIVGTLRSPLLILQGAVFLVLLDRLRQHLGPPVGAGRGAQSRDCDSHGARRGTHALARQLLTESLIVGLVGGALGLLLAAWGLDADVVAGARRTRRAWPRCASTAWCSASRSPRRL